MTKPEELACEDIDQALRQAGWEVLDRASANIDAGQGVAVREFPLKSGYGFADYLLYVETCFTSRLDVEARSRSIFNLHQPETLAEWLDADPLLLPTVDGKQAPQSLQPSTPSLQVDGGTPPAHSQDGGAPPAP